MSAADIFSIGASGLRSFRTQMGAISENISNAGTENYNRRSVELAESSMSMATEALYVPRASFGGSEVAGVRRANDPYLDANVRITGTALGSASARLRWLSDIEAALKDDSRGVGSSLATMYSAVTNLAASPADTSLRTNVLYGVERVVVAFNESSEALAQTQAGLYQTAQGEAVIINDAIKELARINASLVRSMDGTSNQAQLLDSRDAELAKITQRLNVDLSFTPSGATVITYNGTTVVQGETTTSFAVTQNPDGTLNLLHEGTATAAPANGSLSGIFQSADIAKQRLTTLDQLAVQFANDINTWHAQGLTDANVAGGPMVSVGTTAASLAMTISDIADLATKSSDGRLNGNLINISTIRGNSSVEQGWSALVLAHGNLLATTKLEQEAAQVRDDNARAARENVSGVDLDMEAADLMRTQQAYQACAKVIQAAREIIDSVLRIV